MACVVRASGAVGCRSIAVARRRSGAAAKELLLDCGRETRRPRETLRSVKGRFVPGNSLIGGTAGTPECRLGRGFRVHEQAPQALARELELGNRPPDVRV